MEQHTFQGNSGSLSPFPRNNPHRAPRTGRRHKHADKRGLAALPPGAERSHGCRAWQRGAAGRAGAGRPGERRRPLNSQPSENSQTENKPIKNSGVKGA